MRRLPMLLLPLVLTACADSDWQASSGRILDAIQTQQGSGQLSQSDILSGLREALAQGTTTAINQLGTANGFWKDGEVRIPLPAALAKYESTARQFGYGPKLDEFQLTLNRAAEQAVPQVASIFGNAVGKMTVADARSILQGSDDAATQYFRRTAGTELYSKINPIVKSATAKVGVTQQYKQLVGSLGPVLQMGGITATDLDDYVTNKALDGLFLKIADEEQRIRENPAARTTDILRRVFGGG